ncbi:MAG: hypothetical protein GC162_03080 [Planctomycetes bacterium]|nr:hypothetical protein [Planctomycetota bacterium]
MFGTRTCTLLAALLMMGLMAACSDYKSDTEGSTPKMSLEKAAMSTVDQYKKADSSLKRFFDGAAAYAVFPEVAKGAAGIGAAHGNGVLYEGGQIVGYTGLSQGSIGLQLGGQTYSELIFFKDKAAVDEFKGGNMEFSAQASAVAAAEGAAANADYAHGVAIFTRGQQGLMFEASVGGQKFSYNAK